MAESPEIRPVIRPVAKPQTVRRLGPVDVAPLRAQVARLSEKVWREADAVKENDFFCFAHTRHIIFRFPPIDRPHVFYYSRPIWKVWQHWLLPVMTQAAADYGYAQPVYSKAILARLAAGHGIDRHVDLVRDALVHKIHVPLETNPQATLTVGDTAFHLEVGSAYEVNNMAPHGAFNGGTHDRIHFIFEVCEGAGWSGSRSREQAPPDRRIVPPAQPRRPTETSRHSNEWSAYEYRAYGLHLRSAVPLPFHPLLGPSESAPSAPDVTVRLGTVPATLPADPDRVTHKDIWQARPGAFLIHVDGVARYLVTAGRDMLIEPCGGGADDVTAFFTSTPFTALLQQRGVVTLHAAAVETDAGAILLLGRSGMGKSSLAAALVERGFALLADDVTGVVLDADGRPLALPAFPRLRLWADALDMLHWRANAQAPVRRGEEKYWTRMPDRICSTSLPVRAAFVLAAHSGPDIVVEPVAPGPAFRLLWKNTHRKRMVDALGQRPTHFRIGTALARHVPVVQVTRPVYPFLLEALVDRIAAYLHETGLADGAEQRG